ncbi:MAG TPA: tetratricopeptide repeat protein [Bacteroidia bacterium]|nr:tetratricopeptide repeat protein [Bacteroidia bacterium]
MTSEERAGIEKMLAGGVSGRERVDLLNKVAVEYRFSEPQRFCDYATEACTAAEEIGYTEGLARAERHLGYFYEQQADYPKTLSYCSKALEHYKSVPGLSTEIIATNNLVAKVYANLGDFTKGLEYLYESLRLSEETGNKTAETNTLNSMSVLYQRLGNAAKAEECASRGLTLAAELTDQRVLGVTMVNLGNAYGMTKDWTRALEQWKTSLSIFEKLGDEDLQSSVLGNMGITHMNLGEYDRADEYLSRCLAIKKQTGNRYDVARSLQNLASVSSSMKQYRKSLDYCREGLELAALVDARSLEYQLWYEMAAAYKGLGDFENALTCFEKYHSLEKEIFTEEMRLKTDALQLRFAIEKSEKEKEIYRLKNIDLAEANEKITIQKEVIEEKNRDITAGIRYAQRIQEALLPQESALRHGFSEAFVAYFPRDIVSGDFYWSLISEDAVLFAAADCTGHGVPGALMSVMGAAFLSEIVNERGVTDPAEALNLLRLKVITALQGKEERDATESGLRDGMDIVLCRYEPASRLLRFACANNPLWLLRKGNITEFGADKFPVGLHHGAMMNFTTRQVTLQPGDQLFLFTDGFADQFGGTKEKKFGYRRLRELFVSIAGLAAAEQKAALEKAFREWKGENDQVDDLLVIGVKA